jgi:adenylylsulfate kinase
MILDQGNVIWITGLSGVGKSSIAKKILDILCQKQIRTLLLDGDEVRGAIGDPSCGHDRKSRIINGYRISRFAKLFAEQGATVITATMSLFHEIHEWNRDNLPRYFEVYIKADMEILKNRDPKGLYHKSHLGFENNIGGVDLAVEEPLNPDLCLENSIDLADLTPVALSIINSYQNKERISGRLP